MKPSAFAYVAPNTVAETLQILAEHRSEARIIAGGQTLGPMLNMRMVSPKVLVDINRITDLPPITIAKNWIRTGALVRQREAYEHGEIARLLPVLRMTLPHVGHYQTRTRGTLCGSIAHADPTAELPLLLLTLGGSVVLGSKRRQRTVAAADYFMGSLTTAREAEEMILALNWPISAGPTRQYFEEVTTRHGHIALAACAASAALSATGRVASLSLGLTGISDRPLLISTGTFLDVLPDIAWRTAVVEHTRTSIECIDDLHASSAYRRHVAGWLVNRALEAVTVPQE
jgi:2-furoyl-CoA dehydrogenase FAD binding subunit